MSRRILIAATFVSLCASSGLAQGAPAGATNAPPNTWRIDASHSELSFRIRHFVSKVRGTFGSWTGTIVADPQHLAGGSVQVVIDPSTIDTNHERRDADLKSSNFFEVEKYPEITFVSREVKVEGSDLTIVGDLTMRGITRPVTLSGQYNGVTVDNRGRRRIGFEARSTVNRLEWGLTWNRVAEGGGAMLGDDVEIDIIVAGVQQ